MPPRLSMGELVLGGSAVGGLVGALIAGGTELNPGEAAFITGVGTGLGALVAWLSAGPQRSGSATLLGAVGASFAFALGLFVVVGPGPLELRARLAAVAHFAIAGSVVWVALAWLVRRAAQVSSSRVGSREGGEGLRRLAGRFGAWPEALPRRALVWIEELVGGAAAGCLAGFVLAWLAGGNVNPSWPLLLWGTGVIVGTGLGSMMAWRRWSAGVTVVWSVVASLAQCGVSAAIVGPGEITAGLALGLVPVWIAVGFFLRRA